MTTDSGNKALAAKKLRKAANDASYIKNWDGEWVTLHTKKSVIDAAIAALESAPSILEALEANVSILFKEVEDEKPITDTGHAYRAGFLDALTNVLALLKNTQRTASGQTRES